MIHKLKYLKRQLNKTCFTFALIVLVSCNKKQTHSYKFQNSNLQTSERVIDLIAQLSLAEKVSQMQYDVPAIKRLGIPEYNWWNECLHGVPKASEATVSSQGIGMGATWIQS